MRVFVSVDIEGATGIASFSQCSRASAEYVDYPFARQRLHDDLNAVIRGARKAGAGRIVLKDGHGNCKNLLPDWLEPGTECIVGGGPHTDGMMDGIDGSYDAAMLIGYHATCGTPRSLMQHALVGGLRRFWVNGSPAGEILASAAVAGDLGVPLVLVSGDDTACAETHRDIPGALTCCTKNSLANYMGRMKGPKETSPDLERLAEQALSTRSAITPCHIAGPVTMTAEFRTVEECEVPAGLPLIQRIDAKTIEWTEPTFTAAHRKAYTVFWLSMRGRATAS